ncbi:FAD-binding protein [Microtetraspora sp. AC03309]|uniref:FAD-binding protein n=1 Tax=Microtetraspora sp. AC03309 TaxID=2779376 RepID=UPI001E4D2C24|nr:FAD-binding protein [Microtetraspora sp. AC03309]
MSLDEHVDVVVVGFGVSGAAAALAAAEADARVLVLDQRVPVEGRRVASGADRSRDELRAGLRAAARAAGVEVRAQSRVHELVMDAGQVCGVGYATLPAGGAAAARHRWLQRVGDRVPAFAAPVLARAAETVWRAGFRVGEISCSSVVLALHPRHWEFVGPAMWAAARVGSGAGVSMEAARRRRADTVPSTAVCVWSTPELTVRTWCALREPASSAAVQQAELHVDEMTGAVLVSEGRPVPGLYSAIRTRHTGPSDQRTCAEVIVGRRAGLGAVGTRARHAWTGLRFAV